MDQKSNGHLEFFYLLAALLLSFLTSQTVTNFVDCCFDYWVFKSLFTKRFALEPLNFKVLVFLEVTK